MRKVLIVDDEPSVRFVLARTCERAGVPHVEAGSAEAAREELARHGTGRHGGIGLVLDIQPEKTGVRKTRLHLGEAVFILAANSAPLGTQADNKDRGVKGRSFKIHGLDDRRNE